MRKAVLTFTTMLFVIGTIGSNIGPALVDNHPSLVLALSSRNRNLFGSVPYIDVIPYAAIGFVRILIAGIALYFVGRWYGQKALGWVEGNLGELPAIYRWTEKAVDKGGSIALVLMPGSNVVCLLLGHKHMSIKRFVPLLSIGIVIKLVVLRLGGDQFEDQIRSFLKGIEQYQWYVVAALFGLSFFQSMRKGRGKRIIFNIFPSIDTPTCATSTRTFNELAASLDNTEVYCVSADLPFAQGRFCGAEGISNVKTASSFRTNFGSAFGLTLTSGVLKGILARAVVVADEKGKVLHTELVSEIANEPNYVAAINSLR
jgi:thioredoxin-dependent peroxiredoxin